jgi:hypothetical protein
VLAAWADLGFDVYSTSLVAREETIAKDPEGLKAFLRATLKGADYAFRNKRFEEGVGYVVKSHPEVDPDGAMGAAQVGARFVYAEEVTSGKVAVGQFEPARPLHPVSRAEAQGGARGDLHQRPAAREEVGRRPRRLRWHC